MAPNGQFNSVSPEQLDKKFNKEYATSPDKIDGDITDKNGIAEIVEKQYGRIAQIIVRATSDELKRQALDKKPLKTEFIKFFKIFLFVQYIVLSLMLFLIGFGGEVNFILSHDVIVLYVSSVFLETLGALIIMINYAFNSRQEIKLIEILNNAISNYQKGNNSTN